MELLLPLMLTAATAHADTGWRDAARTAITDTVGLDIALGRARVDSRAASVLAGDERWVQRGADVDRATALSWARLVGPAVLSEGEASGWSGRKHCATLKGHDPVPGGRAVVLYSGRPDGQGTEPTPPALTLASQDGHEFAFAQLLPGDTIQVVDGTRRGQRTERIEYRRGKQHLTIERNGTEVEACYGRFTN